MSSLLNFDLFFIGVVIAGAGTLGFSIYFSDKESVTARVFLFFSMMSIFWGITNFISVRVTDPSQLIWYIRLVIFFATWYAFSFLLLAWQFPHKEAVLSKKVFYSFLCWSATISIVTLTPLCFESVSVDRFGATTHTGPGIIVFGLTMFIYIGMSIGILLKKLIKSSGIERKQFEFVFTGMSITLLFILFSNFILPAFFNVATLVYLGGLFVLPFIIGTAYAILQYRLFNVRVALFGLLIFILATAVFFDVLLSTSIGLVLYRIAELVLILVAGILLIRNIVREFKLEQELQETNDRQETLIHFIGHEVKGFLTKDAGSFASLIDGDFGVLPEQLKPFVEHALVESRHGVDSVTTILKASNLKKGTVTYAKEMFDLKALVMEAVEKAKQTATQKGLTLSFNPDDSSYQMNGDRAQINDHVLRNLIDNALNYTPSGTIEVSLKKEEGKLIFAVKDSGIGITEEDKMRLFTEGGHGKDSQTVNVHSTGYGLFIAKQIVLAHEGIISASSEGPGKGSTFSVEFPI
ncbi:MAG: ATP-binding protein [Candidatus Kaiserbacteria bacterium]|nr:ATP-binding protein [Candidatus Kaiserbacteria bacterium]